MDATTPTLLLLPDKNTVKKLLTAFGLADLCDYSSGLHKELGGQLMYDSALETALEIFMRKYTNSRGNHYLINPILPTFMERLKALCSPFDESKMFEEVERK